MSVKFNASHKEEKSHNMEYFREGIHKVTITAVIGGTTDNGKEYIEFLVVGDEGQEGDARLWFTTDKAIGYTFNIVRGIFVHNTKEANRDAIRKKVDAVENSDELIELCQILVDMKVEAWYEVVKSDRTYVNASGETKNSYDRNIYGYEPKTKEVAAVEATFGTVTTGGTDDIPTNL